MKLPGKMTEVSSRQMETRGPLTGVRCVGKDILKSEVILKKKGGENKWMK